MDEASGDVWANRDEPVPSINIPGIATPKHEHTQVLAESSDGEGKRAHLKEKLKDKLQGAKPSHESAAEPRPSMQDRLFAK